MIPLAGFRDALGAFSPPARRYLAAEFLVWTGFGVFQVLFNLYLTASGYAESFVGQAVAAGGLGLALFALPAGWAAERHGRVRVLLAGQQIFALSLFARVLLPQPGMLLAASFLAGAGQGAVQIAAAPFLTEHSTPRERTQLFSAFFATALIATVCGNALGGTLPRLLRMASHFEMPLVDAYRVALLVGAGIAALGLLPLARLRHLREEPLARAGARPTQQERARLVPIALNFLLIGSGAGLVIPFMNLYFQHRHACSALQIGWIFAAAQVLTAGTALFAPAVARRFGRLRTIVATELLSLPFLVSLGFESRLPLAIGAFWLRALLMQAATPLLNAFVMESLPATLRPRSTSINNLVWNVGWAVSASLAGVAIEHLGYAWPFAITAALYGIAAVMFYAAFRGTPEGAVHESRLSEEAKGLRGQGPTTE